MEGWSVVTLPGKARPAVWVPNGDSTRSGRGPAAHDLGAISMGGATVSREAGPEGARSEPARGASHPFALPVQGELPTIPPLGVAPAHPIPAEARRIPNDQKSRPVARPPSGRKRVPLPARAEGPAPDPCESFHRDPTRNPRTRRAIGKSGAKYAKLVRECGPPGGHSAGRSGE